MQNNLRRRFKFSRLNVVAHGAMDWIGSVQSLIVHTLFFVASFGLIFAGISVEKVLLVVTTLVSLEAIYLAIFIQMAVNQNSKSLDSVEEDIDEIQEDVEEIQKDVDEIEKDVDDIQEDVNEIEKGIDEIQKDVDTIEQDASTAKPHNQENRMIMQKVESRLLKLVTQVEKVKGGMR